MHVFRDLTEAGHSHLIHHHSKLGLCFLGLHGHWKGLVVLDPPVMRPVLGCWRKWHWSWALRDAGIPAAHMLRKGFLSPGGAGIRAESCIMASFLGVREERPLREFSGARFMVDHLEDGSQFLIISSVLSLDLLLLL